MNTKITFLGVGLALSSATQIGSVLSAERTNTEITPERTEMMQNTLPAEKIQMRIMKFDEIYGMAEKLCNELPKQPWIGILAITRGGLVPAGIISQILDIRRIEVINIKSYDEKTQGQLEILNNPNVLNGGLNWLVIDDLSDSGKTLTTVRELYPQAFYATLMVKPKGIAAVDLYASEFPQNLWLHFPWEPLNDR